MPISFYHYLSYPQEVTETTTLRRVQSTNAKTGFLTWYTPNRFDSAAGAESELALPNQPTHRVGPISSTDMPSFDIGLRSVAPAGGNPGGGLEAATRQPVWLFGVLEFPSTWVP